MISSPGRVGKSALISHAEAGTSISSDISNSFSCVCAPPGVQPALLPLCSTYGDGNRVATGNWLFPAIHSPRVDRPVEGFFWSHPGAMQAIFDWWFAFFVFHLVSLSK